MTFLFGVIYIPWFLFRGSLTYYMLMTSLNSGAEIISMILLIETFRRRNRLQESKLSQGTIFIYLAFTMIWNILWSVNCLSEKLKWTTSLLLPTPLIDSFLTIIVDKKLRRTFIEMFRLPRYCCHCNDCLLYTSPSPRDS